MFFLNALCVLVLSVVWWVIFVIGAGSGSASTHPRVADFSGVLCQWHMDCGQSVDKHSKRSCLTASGSQPVCWSVSLSLGVSVGQCVCCSFCCCFVWWSVWLSMGLYLSVWERKNNNCALASISGMLSTNVQCCFIMWCPVHWLVSVACCLLMYSAVSLCGVQCTG